MDADLKYLIQTLIEGQTRTDKSVGDLASVVTSHVNLTEAGAKRLEDAHIRTEEAIASLAASVSQFVASADARMQRLEENLDGLIRAITREHSNGKAH